MLVLSLAMSMRNKALGVQILANLWQVLRDPTLWPEPDVFNPERFLTKDGKVLHRPELIPFGLGMLVTEHQIFPGSSDVIGHIMQISVVYHYICIIQ